MNILEIFKLFILLKYVISEVDYTGTLDNQIYQKLISLASVKTMNNTNNFGGGHFLKNVGILYMINSKEDVDKFFQSSLKPSIFVLDYKFLTYSLESYIKYETKENLRGIFILKNKNSSFTGLNVNFERTCLNCEISLYKNDPKIHSWNPKGNAFSFYNFKIPIFAIPEDLGTEFKQSSNEIVTAAKFNEDHNYDHSMLYSAQFFSQQNGTIDSLTCLRRGRCLPIGGLSIWATFSETIAKSDGKEIVVVSSQLDSTALIKDLALGASTLSGVAAALAVADAISKSPNNPGTFEKHILFTFFNGEQWGLAGSSRFVNDISKSFVCASQSAPFCPVESANSCGLPCRPSTDYTGIDFSKIHSIIEFSHIGGFGVNLKGSTTPNNVYLHMDDIETVSKSSLGGLFNNSTILATKFNQSSNVFFTFSNAANNFKDNLKLPPSSAQSFLLKNRSIPAIVIGDFQTGFSSPFFGSELDDNSQLNDENIALICGIANETAKAVYQVASGTKDSVPDQIQANCTLIREFLNCFLVNRSCELSIPYYSDFPTYKGPTSPSGSFVGVPTFNSRLRKFDYKPYLIKAFLHNITGFNKAGIACNFTKDCNKPQVSDLKKKVAEHENITVEQQKLIHSGKILENEKLLSHYNVKEKDFLVLMVTKTAVRTTPKPEVSEPTKTNSASPAQPASNPTSSAVAAEATTKPASASLENADSNLVAGSAYDSATQNLVEMGFEISQVKAAMRAAFNNPDRAAEYLMTGIPEGIEAPQNPVPSATTPSAPATPANAANPNVPSGYENLFTAAANAQRPSSTNNPANENTFAFLRNSPQFQQLRQLVQTQPQLLQPVLQQLGQANPQLLELINGNQDAFLSLLMEGGEGAAATEGGATGENPAGAGNTAPPNQQYISVTPEEEAAINRLAGLGFDRQMAIEAFFACDKNEELAANYLFDAQNGGDW
ncbi:hypothetical protein HDU92_004311 [Lobulomyces angularis]|nr:hypothetical protein HDU92_004311 [Lobulomyces angularis]